MNLSELGHCFLGVSFLLATEFGSIIECASLKVNQVVRELNMLYLELPRLQLDLLIGPEYEYPLTEDHLASPTYANAARIEWRGLPGGMGSESRTGSAMDDEQLLIDNTYFWLKQYLHFFCTNIKIVENELLLVKGDL